MLPHLFSQPVFRVCSTLVECAVENFFENL